MKLYVWGTGCGAGQCIEKGLKLSDITGFIDICPMGKTFLGKPVLLPDQLAGEQPDLIIVATRFVSQVEAECRRLGISEDRILYIKDAGILLDRNRKCTRARELLGQELLDRLLPGQQLITVPDSLRTSVLQPGSDYIRVAVLELLCRRLTAVPGDLAELGVYKGGFACEMNRLMPERKFYLFDTFEGFDPAEGEREKQARHCGDAFLASHRNTGAEQVLKKMPAPEQVVLKPGYFPYSLQGLETEFCLVSLDADFRDSTLEGLRYFWPRLNAGGYLMLHDWGSPTLTGVREALQIYEQELGHFLPSVPIPDIGNSLILQKPAL